LRRNGREKGRGGEGCSFQAGYTGEVTSLAQCSAKASSTTEHLVSRLRELRGEAGVGRPAVPGKMREIAWCEGHNLGKKRYGERRPSSAKTGKTQTRSLQAAKKKSERSAIGGDDKGDRRTHEPRTRKKGTIPIGTPSSTQEGKTWSPVPQTA